MAVCLMLYLVLLQKPNQEKVTQFNSTQKKMPKNQPTTKNLLCSLEELFLGIKKTLVVSRKIIDPSGFLIDIDRNLEINIKSGWKSGTKITFPDEGDEGLGKSAGDLILVIEETPHQIFRRDRNDLVIVMTITLFEALSGAVVKFFHLDGVQRIVSIAEVINPTYRHLIKGDGYVSSKDNTRGDLLIEFKILFPMLSNDQKNALKNGPLAQCTYK